MGLLDPATSDGRVIFFLPWQNHTIAGTTDSPCVVGNFLLPPFFKKYKASSYYKFQENLFYISFFAQNIMVIPVASHFLTEGHRQDQLVKDTTGSVSEGYG
jgi:hypothetical protein